MLQECHGKSKYEREWEEAGAEIAEMVEKMPGLKELTWVFSSLSGE